MANQIRGIILEGNSCSGKTSVYNAIRKGHIEEADTERNMICLSEHYSQNLNLVHGELKKMNRTDNCKVLWDRISMLEKLGDYANSMGEASRRSRGLFFLFERFHLNYAGCFDVMDTDDYQELEIHLCNLNVQTVLCTISKDKVVERFWHRDKKIYSCEQVQEYMDSQNRMIDNAKKSKVPTLILNTDDLLYDKYAKDIRLKLDRAV